MMKSKFQEEAVVQLSQSIAERINTRAKAGPAIKIDIKQMIEEELKSVREGLLSKFNNSK